MKCKVVIWGASGHALVVADILRHRGEYEIIGLLDSVNPDRKGTHFAGLPVLGGSEHLEELKRLGTRHLIFGFGDCSGRLRLAKLAEEAGFQFATAVHPNATVAADVQLGVGSVVMAGAVINSGAVIGRNTIINTCSSVDHECILGEAVHISPGSHLAGKVIVGDGAWIGIGAVVLSGIKVGAHSLAGAGAVITKDVPAGVVVYGVPAKAVRAVTQSETPPFDQRA